jgi:tetratricopeptide (TPR) repeat protein
MVTEGPMVSSEVRRTLTMAAKILMLAGVAAPYNSVSQPSLDRAAVDERRQVHEQIVEEIQARHSDNGAYSLDLVEPLTALGLIYQELGHHALAAATIERTLQIVRANYGLYSLEQAPLIGQAIDNQEARGNLVEAWDLEQELIALAERNRGDLRTVPIFREIGDKRMDMLRRYLAGEFPPQIVIGCFYEADIGSCSAGSRSILIRSILWDAWKHYSDAIRAMLKHEVYSSDELRELEMELVRSSYEHGDPERGRQSLRRLLSYDVANSEPWLTRINSLMQIADWDFLFAYGRNDYEAALQTYVGAYEQLEQHGIPQESIEALFSPELPVVLPAFLPNPLLSDEAKGNSAYIDVAFEIGRYGEGRKIEILDSSRNASDDAKSRLARLILRSRFRPRFADGDLADSTPVLVRYHLSE